MKVLVKSKDINFSVPVPLIILKNRVRFSEFIFKHLIKKDTNSKEYKEFMKHIEGIDTEAFLMTIKALKEYKGLVIAEIKTCDGKNILITA